MILRVGLTGGLASGKSTAAELLAGLGCRVVDADEVVDALYRPGRPGHEAIVRVYGRGILTAGGEIDRQKLASIAFSSAEEATRLNDLIHPLVIEEERRIIDETNLLGEDQIVVVEATMLLESGGKERYDVIVVVDLPEEIQVRRAVERGMIEGDARARISRQMSRANRLAAADVVIDNSGDEAALERQVRALHGRLAERLAQRVGSK
ncbi:MAG TPA: dephospho-CoA kinase [Thermoanaerobaculia bacterium]|nr:dephospho-CoA kinase [Thermoanaerobaculia bacterium]